MLNHSRMGSAKPICTPLTMSIHLSKLGTSQLELHKEYMFCVPYESVVGSLIYVMVRINQT